MWCNAIALIIPLALGLLAAPLAAEAQQAKVPTIGVLVVGAPSSDKFWRLFRDGMRDLGYIEGQSVRYEFRSDQGQAGRLPALAAELVQRRVDVIVTWFTPAATAAKQATREIPIVCAICGDPVGTGLVESLARPGGNLTGLSGIGAELAGKGVELLRELSPSVHRVAALGNALDPFSKPFLAQIQLAGKATATPIQPIMIRGSEELDAAFAALESDRPDAVIVQPNLPIKRVAELALQYRMPALSAFRLFAEEGGLMSYWVAEADLYRRAAVFVDKLLKGAKPADLLVEQPTKFELVINLKTAKALGLTIPPTLLFQAAEVIR
jgi:putative ABC transport system substrate-binding protein